MMATLAKSGLFNIFDRVRMHILLCIGDIAPTLPQTLVIWDIKQITRKYQIFKESIIHTETSKIRRKQLITDLQDDYII